MDCWCHCYENFFPIVTKYTCVCHWQTFQCSLTLGTVRCSFFSNIRLGRRGLSATNSLAYFDGAKVTTKKCFDNLDTPDTAITPNQNLTFSLNIGYTNQKNEISAFQVGQFCVRVSVLVGAALYGHFTPKRSLLFIKTRTQRRVSYYLNGLDIILSLTRSNH